MTTTDSEATEPTPAQSSRRGKRVDGRNRAKTLTAIGIVLMLIGLGIVGWVAWQFWGTNWQSNQRQDEATTEIEKGWQGGKDVVRTEWGDVNALVRIPRFGDDYEMPILEGSSDEALAAGISHMEDTQTVGANGNYALAAHRVTHGEPFADFPDLEPGDRVVVETRTRIYTYELDTGGTDLIVPFTAGWVLDKSPKNPEKGGTQPPKGVGKRLITLLTCSEIFHTDNRSVAFGHLVDAKDKTGQTAG